MTEKGLKVRLMKDKLFKFIILSLSIISLAPLFLILFFVFERGLKVINWSFLTQLPKPVGVAGGGISNAIVGTLMLIAIACLVAVPLGIAAGVYLSESKKTKIAYFTRLTVDVLQGTPSIVIGIIAYLWIVLPMGKFSALSGGIALGLMTLPLVVRGSEEVLKLIPHDIREASLALGVPRYRTILKVIIPAGIPGIVSAILLGISRIAGETAPLLFTAFGNPFMNLNIFKPVNSLPLLIFNYAMSPYEDWQTIAWGASVVLILIVLGGNILSRIVVRKWQVQF